ncbi:MAG: dTDP-4-dehydrorhamnose reductase [Gammaproteobacteria bacterium]|nr:dTDP-4-dehydrorhamnose reductase [Gammaproteobacteria bacterium]
MKLLVFGKDGQIGSALCRQMASRDGVMFLGRQDVDLQDLDTLRKRIVQESPDLVINAAAYTAVDRAESEPALAHTINADAPRVMAESAQEISAWLIHYSTDYVFDGRADRCYVETCETKPVNVYGRTKLAGEEAVQRAGDRYVIVRTSWVYALQGHNFLNTILRLAQKAAPLRIVDDQRGSPTSADAIARGTVGLVDRIHNAPVESGVYHMSCGGETTWFGFANEIVRVRGLEGVRVQPITTADFPTPAERPRYSVLSNAKLSKTFGIELPHWREALIDTLSQVDHPQKTSARC